MLESTANWALAILGISFLIFMHELGHYLAARMFKVRVETFSIGFGPRLLGFTSGDTDYRLSAIPLGGYVKMAGEYGDYRDDEPLQEGDLMSTPIWQRVVIFSGGVVMNFILAALIFPVAFGLGVPFTAPVVGDVTAAGPAWQAGLRPGDEIVSVSGQKVWGFTDVVLEIAVGDPDDIVLEVLRDGETLQLPVQPEHADGIWDIGVFAARDDELVVLPDGPAEAAGLQDGDRLISLDGRRIGELHHGSPLSSWALIVDALPTGEPIELVVDRQGTLHTVTLTPTVLPTPPNADRKLGAMPLETRIAGLRGAALGPEQPLRVDDVILRADGRPMYLVDDIDAALAASSGGLAVDVLRDGSVHAFTLSAAAVDQLRRGEAAFGGTRDTRIQVVPGGALHAAGMRTGDEILALGGTPLRTYQDLLDTIQSDKNRVDWHIRYLRDGVEHELNVRTAPQTRYDYGLGLRTLAVRHEVTWLGALGAGWDATVNALRTTGLTLGKLFTGDIGVDNLGGPISIGVITKEAASLDFARLLFFLALLSVNLGFINILPVPVLDGGQIVFLLCEKVKGSRLSERFMVNANIAGFVAILALMALVTYNDIKNVLF